MSYLKQNDVYVQDFDGGAKDLNYLLKYKIQSIFLIYISNHSIYLEIQPKINIKKCLGSENILQVIQDREDFHDWEDILVIENILGIATLLDIKDIFIRIANIN